MSLSIIIENLSASEEFCLLLLFDFSEAFDKIKRLVLLKKLSSFNISRNLSLLIKDYMAGRKQSESFGGYQS